MLVWHAYTNNDDKVEPYHYIPGPYTVVYGKQKRRAWTMKKNDIQLWTGM